jgi:putative DNA methylase
MPPSHPETLGRSVSTINETESMSVSVKTRKKLIEVALPLEAINIASAREKSIRHGHPSTLHLWWARRPLAAARAVIFSQMVDDPSSHPELFPTEEAQETERQRIFRILEKLVLWENTTNEAVLNEARQEIWKSWRSACEDNRDHPQATELFNSEKLPAFHDPFAGGGALPLEAQRLGLEAYASDLNPVAVTINKAMIEIPPRFAGRKPVGPIPDGEKQTSMAREWPGATGLAEDVRRYGAWMRAEAEKRIGHLYPKVEITAEMADERPDLKPLVGQQLTVIAWLWARTVKSPDPAFADVEVPLASTFVLSSKAGKDAYVEPVVEGKSYRFTAKIGTPPESAKNGTKADGRGANFLSVLSGTPITGDYIKAEGKAHRMGARLMAMVAESAHGRIYLTPSSEHESASAEAHPEWRPVGDMPARLTGGTCVPYGLKEWGDLFTSRQLMALNTFSDLVTETIGRCCQDAIAAGLRDDNCKLDDGGSGATAYAEAIATNLALAVDKTSDYNSSLVMWSPTRDQAKTTFARQALPMVWDFAEVNPFAHAAGDLEISIQGIGRALTALPTGLPGFACHQDAQTQQISNMKVVSTDPPYYDNIGYADLSDFFYVWLRKVLRPIFPLLYSTVAVPKVEELVASAYRHGGREKAESFFLEGMTRVISNLAEQAHPSFPVSIYYAFKQSETDEKDGTSSTGWETFLEAVIQSGFALSGTWPIRTERATRSIGIGTNALASSIVLVCRKREADAMSITRREFLNELKGELPKALEHLQHSNIAPVDLQQAAIGPGIAIYSRYSRVVNAAGDAMPVKEALALINETLDDALAEQEGDFDSDTRWALTWFDQMGFAEGDYGLAETLSKAKNTSVAGMMDAGILSSGGGKVRLLKPEELNANWEPETDTRKPVWEALHHLVRALNQGGETAAAALTSRLGSRADAARELAYRLYILCERKHRAQEALAYNALVQSWPEIQRLASEQEAKPAQLRQTTMFS